MDDEQKNEISQSKNEISQSLNEELNNELERKNLLIATEIITKNYSSDEFYNFLKQKDNNKGDDLNLWTVLEIQDIIKEFQESKEKNKDLKIDEINKSIEISQSNNNELEQSNNNFISNNNVLESNNNFISNNNVLEQSNNNLLNSIKLNNQLNENANNIYSARLTTGFFNIGDEINCQLPDSTDFVNCKNLTVNLMFPERSKDDENYGKKFVYTFCIETSPIKFSVRRRQQDFYWLRKMLVKFYPGIFIPPINDKNLSDSSNDIKVTKRMTDCKHFLEEIIKDELLRSSKIFFDFMTTVKEKEFQIKRKAYEKMEGPKKIEDLHSRTGKINLDGSIFREENRLEKAKNNLKKNQNIIDKLNKEFKKLIQEMSNLKQILHNVSDIFKELTNETQIYPENKNLIKSYLSNQNLMNDWAYSIKRQSTIFDLHIRQYFKYLFLEYNSLKELQENFENNKIEYLKKKKNLEDEKEKLYIKKDVKKWELKPEDANVDVNNKQLCFEKMLPKKTKELNDKMKLTCYYGNYFESEFERIRNQMEENIIDISDKFYNQCIKELGEQKDMWEKFHNFENLDIPISTSINVDQSNNINK